MSKSNDIKTKNAVKSIYLDLDAIELDEELQPRAGTDADLIAEYVEVLEADAEFDMRSIVVFRDADDKNWLADGFHRHAAYTEAGRKDIPVKIHQGSRRDAFAFSLSANGTHGKRRTNEDKHHAVVKALSDAEWVKFNDCQIAELCAVSTYLVHTVRKELNKDDAKNTKERIVRTKHGGTTTMNTSKIGRPKKEAVQNTADDDGGLDDMGGFSDSATFTDDADNKKEEVRRLLLLIRKEDKSWIPIAGFMVGDRELNKLAKVVMETLND